MEHLPQGTLVAIAGGKDIADPAAVIARLDKARAKYSDMILVHGGGPGVEKIAANWAYRNGVHQIVCKPDWDRHGRAAPFRRNEELLNLLPKGVIAFPGSGITENLVDKARQLGIRVTGLCATLHASASATAPTFAHCRSQYSRHSCGRSCGARPHFTCHCPAQLCSASLPLNRRGGFDPPGSPASIFRSFIQRKSPAGPALDSTPHASVMLAVPCAAMACPLRHRRLTSAPLGQIEVIA